MVLNIETAGALISGSKASEGSGNKSVEVSMAQETWTIKVLRPFYHNGKIQEAGTILSLSQPTASLYVGANKAERIPEPAKVTPASSAKPQVDMPEKTDAPKAIDKPAGAKKGG